MTTLPTLTDEQRRHNLELAMKVRRACAELKHQLKTGQVSLVDALDDERAQRMYVRQFLMSLPGIAQSRADGIMHSLGIAPKRRVHGLGRRQRAELIAVSEKFLSSKTDNRKL